MGKRKNQASQPVEFRYMWDAAAARNRMGCNAALELSPAFRMTLTRCLFESATHASFSAFRKARALKPEKQHLSRGPFPCRTTHQQLATQTLRLTPEIWIGLLSRKFCGGDGLAEGSSSSYNRTRSTPSHETSLISNHFHNSCSPCGFKYHQPQTGSEIEVLGLPVGTSRKLDGRLKAGDI